MKPIIPNLTRPKGDPKILEVGPSSLTWADRIARDIGWISIGLGLTQLVGARMLTRKLGLWGCEGMTRACGAREIASGIVTLSTERHTGLWMRVAGDVADIAVLTRALHPWNPMRQNAKMALMMVGYHRARRDRRHGRDAAEAPACHRPAHIQRPQRLSQGFGSCARCRNAEQAPPRQRRDRRIAARRQHRARLDREPPPDLASRAPGDCCAPRRPAARQA